MDLRLKENGSSTSHQTFAVDSTVTETMLRPNLDEMLTIDPKIL